MPAASSFGFFSPHQKLSPAKIVQLYAVIGILWIIFSDTVAVWLVKDVEQLEEIGTYKGIFFILATAGFLHLLLGYYVQQLRSSQETSHLAEQEIKKLAGYDRETGLPNHNLLLDRLNQVIAFNGHKGKRTAVIYISLTMSS
jgi:polar amino acid transport system substrate-binding protein